MLSDSDRREVLYMIKKCLTDNDIIPNMIIPEGILYDKDEVELKDSHFLRLTKSVNEIVEM